MKKLIQIFLAMLIAIPVMSQTVQLDQVNDAVPGTVTVNLDMYDFTVNAGSVTLNISYDQDLLTYTGSGYILYDGVNIIVSTPFPSVLRLVWYNTAGSDMNGTFAALQFDYSGGFATDLTFQETLELTKVNGEDIDATYVDGGISPDLSSPHGTATLAETSANAGDNVSVSMDIVGFATDPNQAYSMNLKVGYDIEKLVYVGESDNTLGFAVEELNGIITLVKASDGNPLAFSNPVIKLDFTYLGGGTAAVEFLPGSVVTNNLTSTLITKFEAGKVDLTTPTGGTLTIEKVYSAGKTYELGVVPGDTLWFPASVSVPITADAFTTEAGSIFLKIAFDNTRLTYTGFTPNQFTGWIPAIDQEAGLLTFTKTSASALIIADGALLTLNFDYMDGVADIIFEPGTLLTEIDNTPIPVGLTDGFVADFSKLNLTVFLEGMYVGGASMRKAQDNIGVGPFDKFPGTVADQITVELHDASAYGTVVWSKNEVNLNTDGTATINVPRTYSDFYYLTVKHRNHLETVSALTIDFSQAVIDYDFTDLALKAFGANQKDLGDGNFAIFAGDVNQDGSVNLTDRINVNTASFYGWKGYVPEDVNGDGSVNLTDRINVNTAAFYGRQSKLPPTP